MKMVKEYQVNCLWARSGREAKHERAACSAFVSNKGIPLFPTNLSASAECLPPTAFTGTKQFVLAVTRNEQIPVFNIL